MLDSTPAAPAADVGTIPAAAEAAVAASPVVDVPAQAPAGPALSPEQKANLKGLDAVLEALFVVVTPEEAGEFFRALATPSVALDKLEAFRARIRDLANS